MDHKILPITQEEFLIQHLTEGKSYKAISAGYGIPEPTLTYWWNTGTLLREQIKRSNTLYHSKKNKPDFSGFEGITQRGFYEWYIEQNRTCYYCGIEEEKLSELFHPDKGILKTKRGRGRVLELERVNADTNMYSKENCVFACYLCNNHKSDLISEAEHKAFFAPSIKAYLDHKYAVLHKLEAVSI
jgi:hypothetical protein